MANNNRQKPTVDHNPEGVSFPVTYMPDEEEDMDNVPHRRKGEQTLEQLITHPLFKLSAMLGNIIIAIAAAWAIFVWNSVQRDIQDIKNNYSQMQAIVNNYNSERLAISQRLDSFSLYQSEALGRGRDMSAKIARIEGQLERHDRDIAELRAPLMKGRP